jgi:thioesterase domain-containing protein
LGIQSIGIFDNFFELGGTSLLAVQMLTKIEHRLSKKLPLATFLQAATIEKLATLIQEEHPELWSTLVPIQPNGEKPPLFFIHGGDANVLVFHNFLEYLGTQQPVYALQPHREDGKQGFLSQVEDIATEYIQHIRSVQPQGPYNLAGYSVGGIIVFEIAQQLVAQKEEVALLALLDIASPKHLKQEQSTSNWNYYYWNIFKSLKIQNKLRFLGNGLKQKWDRTTTIILKKLAPNFQKSEEVILSKVYKDLINAVCKYNPKIYPGQITLFRCTKQHWWVNHDRELGWAELTEKPVEVFDIPGNHNDLVRSSAKHVAQKLHEHLNQ